MQNPTREPAGLPPILAYSCAITIGTLAALAIQLWLSRTGANLVGLWQDGFSTQALRLSTAGPWWAMAGAAFIAGGTAAAALSRLPPPWSRFRLLRWVAAAAVVFALADIGHSPAAPTNASMVANVAASLAALGMAALMAFCGAYFTVRR